METDLLERLVKLEVVALEKHAYIEAQLLELRQTSKELEDNFHNILRKHTEEEMIVMNKILSKLEGIEAQTANFKGMLGGILIATSSVWFILSQIASWLHLDFIKLLSSALGK